MAKIKRRPRHTITKHRGLRCQCCDGPAIPGNPLYPQKPGYRGKFIHLYCK